MERKNLKLFLKELCIHRSRIFLIKNLIASEVISFNTPEKQLRTGSEAIRLFRKFFVGVDGYAPVQSIFGGDAVNGYTLTFESGTRFNQNIPFIQGYFTLYRPTFHLPLKTSVSLGLPGALPNTIIEALYQSSPNNILVRNIPQSIIDQLLSIGNPSGSFITLLPSGQYQLLKDATVYCYN